jgi:hypothetical protein
MTFWVDGQRVAQLRQRRTARIEVAMGTHVVQARMDWQRSAPLEIKLSEEASVSVTGSLTEHSMTLTGMVLRPRTALELRVT